MRKIKIFIFTFILYFYGCKVTEQPKMDETTMLKKQVDSLKMEIVDLEEQIEIMQDELRMREGEISYWGQKYDSCVEVLKVKK